jgi:hypothetical protein
VVSHGRHASSATPQDSWRDIARISIFVQIDCAGIKDKGFLSPPSLSLSLSLSVPCVVKRACNLSDRAGVTPFRALALFDRRARCLPAEIESRFDAC